MKIKLNPWPAIKSDLRKIAAALLPFSLVLYDLKFIIMGLIAGFFIFTVPDQARDNFVNMFVETRYCHINKFYHAVFFLSICMWSFHAWGGARTILYLRNYRQYKPMVIGSFEVFIDRIKLLQKIFPRLLAVVPFLIIAFAIQAAVNSNIFSGIYLLSGGLVFIMLTYRKQMAGYTAEVSNKRFELFMVPLGFKYKLSIVVLGLFFLTYLIAVTMFIEVSLKLRSMLIVAISINMWTYIMLALQYFSWKARASVVVMLILVLYTFSFFNNNHNIRTLHEIPCGVNDSFPQLMSIDDHYREFRESRDSTDRDTVFIIAAQGGGIRAAFWTTSVLKQLCSINPGFANQLYAITGASGGSVGGAVFISLLRHYSCVSDSICISNDIEKFYKKDFLAPLTASLLGPDMLQKFLPFGVKSFDRARYLEESWEMADTTKFLSGSFLEMGRKIQDSLHAPLLLINSTWVENGRRTIISPVALDPCSTFSKEPFSLLDHYPHDIRLSTAIGMGARFPFITPGAVVKTDNCDVLGTFVDGGYVENTALATAIDIKDLIKVYHHQQKDSARPLVIHIIYIENGDTAGTNSSLKGMYETKTVINGFYNSWDGQDKVTVDKIQNYVKEYNKLNESGTEPVRLAFSRITLPRNTKTILPLGWVLSDPAWHYMIQQVKPVVTKAMQKVQSF